jgi:cytochrome d ubiquinol oxidase subunit I
LAGDLHGLNTLEHQPAKVMAMEGHFQSHPNGAPLILFGLPDQEAAETRYALSIPKAGSLILKQDLNAPLGGLDTVDRANWPPVAVVFWSFRIHRIPIHPDQWRPIALDGPGARPPYG